MEVTVHDHIKAHIDGRHPEPSEHVPECPVCVWVIEQGEQPAEVLSADRYVVQP